MNMIKDLYFRKVTLKCNSCGKDYEVKPSRVSESKCCSRQCHGEYLSKKYTGVKRSIEWRKNMSESKKGEKHPLWKGNKVGYKSLHQWLSRTIGKATKCGICNSENNVEWSNISKKYTRNIEDWRQLCKKCHYRYDHDGSWGVATKTFIQDISGNLGKRKV